VFKGTGELECHDGGSGAATKSLAPQGPDKNDSNRADGHDSVFERPSVRDTPKQGGQCASASATPLNARFTIRLDLGAAR
jgi:hypothetical protein